MATITADEANQGMKLAIGRLFRLMSGEMRGSDMGAQWATIRSTVMECGEALGLTATAPVCVQSDLQKSRINLGD
jgi:hypothetical protein